MERAYEIRIYPNADQRARIEATFGAARWVYNRCLEMREKAYARRGETASVNDLAKMIPVWKRTCAPWLAQADSMALQQAVRDLGRAYDNFFRNVRLGRRRGKRNPYGFPQFKSKHDSRQSYRTQNFTGKNVEVVDARHVKLPKLGLVRARVSRTPGGRIVNATVKRTPAGKYFVVLCCAGCPEPRMPGGAVGVMGVDAGVHDIATCSDGTRFPNPRSLKRAERRLAREQRKLSRRIGARKGERKSANFERQRAKVARAHEKVANRRRDAIHKATTAIVRESQAVAVEDLNVKGMMANHNLARGIADASMGELLRQLEYKCAWYGRGYVEVSRWFPSSRLCPECGGVFGGLELSMREWVCPECGAAHDRDLNAAENIAREGARILEGTAGHAGTRGQMPAKACGERHCGGGASCAA